MMATDDDWLPNMDVSVSNAKEEKRQKYARVTTDDRPPAC